MSSAITEADEQRLQRLLYLGLLNKEDRLSLAKREYGKLNKRIAEIDENVLQPALFDLMRIPFGDHVLRQVQTRIQTLKQQEGLNSDVVSVMQSAAMAAVKGILEARKRLTLPTNASLDAEKVVERFVDGLRDRTVLSTVYAGYLMRVLKEHDVDLPWEITATIDNAQTLANTKGLHSNFHPVIEAFYRELDSRIETWHAEVTFAPSLSWGPSAQQSNVSSLGGVGLR